MKCKTCGIDGKKLLALIKLGRGHAKTRYITASNSYELAVHRGAIYAFDSILKEMEKGD